MFLSVTRERNPDLLTAALQLHQSGIIPPDTFVLDIDRIVGNARIISETAEAYALAMYVMTKQCGRNPFMARAAVHGGLSAAVAVDTPEARLLHLHGVHLGHVGHLVQIAGRDSQAIVRMRPQVISVFSTAAIARIATAAYEEGIEQSILLRISDPTDFVYPGQEGGFTLSELREAVEAVASLPSVRIAGVTAFPCLLMNTETGTVQSTPNLEHLLEAAHILQRDFGLDHLQINAPSVTSTSTIPLLAERGVTHGEPGSAVTGNTPLHIGSTQPEVPAAVYVSEVASVRGDTAYCFGGGFYARSRVQRALVVGQRNDEHVLADATQLPADSIDYYGTVRLPRNKSVSVGDTVLFAFRSQIFTSRSYVAAVAGITRRQPELLGLCDSRGNVLGDDLLPVGSVDAQGYADRAWSRYLQMTPADGAAATR